MDVHALTDGCALFSIFGLVAAVLLVLTPIFALKIRIQMIEMNQKVSQIRALMNARAELDRLDRDPDGDQKIICPRCNHLNRDQESPVLTFFDELRNLIKEGKIDLVERGKYRVKHYEKENFGHR